MKKLSLLFAISATIITCFVGTNGFCMQTMDKETLYNAGMLSSNQKQEFLANKAHERRVQKQHLFLSGFVSAVTFPVMLLKKYPVATSAKYSLIACAATYIGTIFLRSIVPNIFERLRGKKKSEYQII